MFNLPDTKPVRRSEIFSPSPSPPSSPDPATLALFRSRLANVYEIEPTVSNPEANRPVDTNPTSRNSEPNDATELEFRLFSARRDTTGSARPTIQKIRIRSPSRDGRPPGFVVPERARSYYFADSASEQRKAEISSVAVDGLDVVAWSKRPCPGCAYPWKVTRLRGSRPLVRRAVSGDGNDDGGVQGGEVVAVVAEDGKVRRRVRMGKKGRIALRKKEALRKKKVEDKVKEAAEKEAAEREKRTRRNREKKVKKKQRDKAKNLAEAENTQAAAAI